MTYDECWVEDFRRGHDARLRELKYPPAIVNKLVHDREQWLHSMDAVCCREKKAAA